MNCYLLMPPYIEDAAIRIWIWVGERNAAHPNGNYFLRPSFAMIARYLSISFFAR